MRPAMRIVRILNKIKEVWSIYPDMRFFQLLLFIIEYLPKTTGSIDLFYLEDDMFEKALDALLEEYESEDD